MKLSTKSRYGTRMMLDLASHYNQGPVQIGDISRREGISVKYLEQLIIPLKKAGLIVSVRGPKGGHMLARPPDEVTIGEIVRLLEGGISLTHCVEDPAVCEKSSSCPTRTVWEHASQAMVESLNALTLATIIKHGDEKQESEMKTRRRGRRWSTFRDRAGSRG